MPFKKRNPNDYITIPQQEGCTCVGCAFHQNRKCAVVHNHDFMCVDDDGKDIIFIKKEK